MTTHDCKAKPPSIQGFKTGSRSKPDRTLAKRFIGLMESEAFSRTASIPATIFLVMVMTLSVTNAAASSIPIANTLQTPIRAAFYYPWFPEAWDQKGISPYTNYHPSLGSYDSSDPTVLKQHIAAMQYGGIQAGIASWWGQGSKTDARIPALLKAASGTSFQWTIYYEPEGQGDPSVAQITSDLTYIHDHYANDPGFLTIGGRFVVFVYGDANDGCGMADRWKQANTINAYVVLKVFAGYKTCASQPDGWHQYSPAVATDSQKGYSYAISPGFWKAGESPRLARDLSAWNTDIRDMIASNAPFQLITTFNEWGEGTAVESATEWSSPSGYGAYLDALHNNGQVDLAPGTTAGPTATAIPGASPTIFSTDPAGTTTKFTASADAFVSASAPNTNYGKSKQLRTDNSPIVKSYLRFDVQGLTGSVTKATLRVYSKTKSTAGYNVYMVSDTSWGETAITYNNAPSVGSLEGSSGKFASGVWTTVDITPFVTGNGTISLALTGINSTAVSYVSREGGTNKPELEVITSGNAVVPSAAPSVTPSPTQISAGSPTATETLPAGPSVTPSPTNIPPTGPSATPSPTEVISSSPTATDTSSADPSATPSPTQVSGVTVTATNTVPAAPTATASPAPIVTASPTSGASSTVTYLPSADAYTEASSPTSNTGILTQLRIDNSPVVNSYLRFDIEGLSGPVTKATLRVYANSSSSAGYQVYSIPDTTWGETTLTYNNAPPFGSLAGSMGAFSGGSWTSVDITSLIAGNGAISVALTDNNSTAVSFVSREGGANAPQLVITVGGTGASPTTAPSPTATQGVAPTQVSTITPTIANTSTAGASVTPTATQVVVPTNTPMQVKTAAPTPTKTSTPGPSNTPGASNIQHVFVVVMENHSYQEVWNTSSSPYITSLGNAYARATNYHASIHPSLPNYLQLYGGSNYGITTDCNPSTSCHVNAVNLADNLEAKGLTWKGYMESMPSPCYLTTSGNYAPKHNPFVYFDDIRNNSSRCTSHVVPYTALASDLGSAATTPNFAFITPNLCNDMHDCSVGTGDNWLKSNLPAILNSPACTVDKCLLILTWDEDDSSQSNQVLTIFAGSAAKTGGVTSAVSYTHYSALKTVENIFGLPTQTNNDAAASPMSDLLR